MGLAGLVGSVPLSRSVGIELAVALEDRLDDGASCGYPPFVRPITKQLTLTFNLTPTPGFYRRERWEGPLANALLLLRECRQHEHNLQVSVGLVPVTEAVVITAGRAGRAGRSAAAS